MVGVGLAGYPELTAPPERLVCMDIGSKFLDTQLSSIKAYKLATM